MVNGLEDAGVELARLGLVKRQTEHLEHISQSLDPDADGAVAHVRLPGRLCRVIVLVDDPVQVPRYDTRHVVKLPKVKIRVGSRRSVRGPVRRVLHERRQTDAGQITHGRLVGGRNLHNFRAQVARLDDADVLLIRLAVYTVLVAHIGRPSLNLALQDRIPYQPRLDRLLESALCYIRPVQLVKLFTVHVRESRALMRAHQVPLLVILDLFHEEVRDPHGCEQVTAPHLLVALVETQLQELHDVRVPRLEVDGEGALALPTTLVDVPGGVVEDAEHGHDTVSDAICTLDR